MGGSDLSPASSWSTPDLLVTAGPPCEPSPHPWTTLWLTDRNVHHCPWQQLHPQYQRGWYRWRDQRSPPAWHRSCQICLWWPSSAWSIQTCCAAGGPAGRAPHRSELCHLLIWQGLYSYEPLDLKGDIRDIRHQKFKQQVFSHILHYM